MMYRVDPLQISLLVRSVQAWLDSERQLFAIYIDSIRGKGNGTAQTQRGEYVAAILDEVISAEQFVDTVLDTYAEFGGKFQLRAVWVGDDGEPDWEHAQSRRFNAVPEAPGTRSGSRGQDAATEQLSQSLAKGFDTLTGRLEESQERTLAAMKDGGDRTERFFERLLELQSVGSNTATTQAIALSEQISRAQMAEFKLELVQANQENSVQAVLIEMMPHLMSSPLISNLASLLGAWAKDIGSRGPSPLSSGGPSPQSATGPELQPSTNGISSALHADGVLPEVPETL